MLGGWWREMLFLVMFLDWVCSSRVHCILI
jgi:hypothetical protein